MRLDLGFWHGENGRSLRQRKEDLLYALKPEEFKEGLGGFNEYKLPLFFSVFTVSTSFVCGMTGGQKV